MKQSEKLFLRGYITQAQLEQDRFERDRARQELDLSKTNDRFQESASKLELIEAEQRLASAEERVVFTERLFTKGFATQTEVDKDRRMVQRAKRALAIATEKLKAAKEIFNKSDK